MATIKAVTLKRKDKNGLCNIQIAICHHQKTAYIPTIYKVKPEDFSGGVVIRGKQKGSVNSDIIRMVNEYTERLTAIDNIDAFTVSQIKKEIEQGANRFTMLSEAFSAYRKSLTKTASINGVDNTYKLLQRFLNGKDITLESITPKWASDFHSFAMNYEWEVGGDENTPPTIKHYSSSTIAHYIQVFKSVINYSINHGNFHYNVYPFSKLNLKVKGIRENFITIDTFNAVRDSEPRNNIQILAKDIFLLSFYLGGMNLVDMIKIDFRTDKVTYIRTKTEKKHISVTIPIFPQARVIIGKYINDEGRLVFSDIKYMSIIAYINRGLKDMVNTDELVTFYSARKFFAQVGRNLGISDNVIDYVLGHSPARRGIIQYYSRIMPELAEEAMKMIFEFVDKPEDIKAIFRRNILKQLNG